MTIVEEKIELKELKNMSLKMFGNLVKAVVDVEKNILIVDSELHSDEEAYLINLGSKQENLWGINIYPDLDRSERVEFDSMINLRPSQGNSSRGVESIEIRKKILDIVNSKLVE